MKGLFLSVVFLVTLSCDQQDINITCADPLGTDTESLNDMALSCFQPEFAGCFRFELQGDMPVIRSLYKSTPADAPYLSDAGEVTCLSEVKKDPAASWSYALYAKLHHGYVIKLSDGTYGRVYIDSWLKNGSKVSQVNITRQYAF